MALKVKVRDGPLCVLLYAFFHRELNVVLILKAFFKTCKSVIPYYF